MNVELTNTPELEPPVQETPRVSKLILCYGNMKIDNLVGYQTKYIIFGSWSLSYSSSTIFQEKFHLHFLYQHKNSSYRWKKIGILSTKRNTLLGFHLC